MLDRPAAECVSGIFATNPVTLTNTTIADNSPDQCDGC